MNPFFSIIIPVYNVAPYLRACLDSVLAAEKELRRSDDFRCRELRVELICVDDGSEDASGQILDEYERVNSTTDVSMLTLKVIHQENRGLGPARNSGLNVSTGDYVLFVDSDDAVVPWWLSNLAIILLVYQPDLLRFGYQDVSSQNEVVVRKSDCQISVSCLLGCDDAILVNAASHIGSMYSWRCCFRRSAIGDIRYEPIQPGEDILFATRVFMCADRYVCTDDVLYKYLQRPGSTMHRKVTLEFIVRDLQVMRMRHEIMTSWEQYHIIKKEHLKGMKHEFAVKAHWIGGFCGDDAEVAKRYFFDEGTKVFTEGFISIIFKWRCWGLFCLIYRLNWRLRSTLLKCSWVRIMKNIVRGRGER